MPARHRLIAQARDAGLKSAFVDACAKVAAGAGGNSGMLVEDRQAISERYAKSPVRCSSGCLFGPSGRVIMGAPTGWVLDDVSGRAFGAYAVGPASFGASERVGMVLTPSAWPTALRRGAIP
jgi:hypothetical protein